MTGQQLREFREASAVRASEVAHQAGWPRQRVSEIERAKSVQLDTAETFVNAVERLRAGRDGRGLRVYRLRVNLYVESLSMPGQLSGPLAGTGSNPLIAGREGSKVVPW